MQMSSQRRSRLQQATMKCLIQACWPGEAEVVVISPKRKGTAPGMAPADAEAEAASLDTGHGQSRRRRRNKAAQLRKHQPSLSARPTGAPGQGGSAARGGRAGQEDIAAAMGGLALGRESSKERTSTERTGQVDITTAMGGLTLGRGSREERQSAEEDSERSRKQRLRSCAWCGATEPTRKTYKRCARCRDEGRKDQRFYCSKECQVKDWWEGHQAEHLADAPPE